MKTSFYKICRIQTPCLKLAPPLLSNPGSAPGKHKGQTLTVEWILPVDSCALTWG